MKRLFLIRHGATAQTSEFRYGGATDLPLCDKGHAQARAVARRLSREGIRDVFTSPLRRSLDTAREIAAPHQVEPRPVPQLREIDFGRWEGATFAELSCAYPYEVGTWLARPEDFAFPGGESVHLFLRRVEEAFDAIVSNSKGDCAVVAHAGVLRTALCRLCGWGFQHWYSFQLNTGSLTILEHCGSRAVVRTLNDTCHLEQE